MGSCWMGDHIKSSKASSWMGDEIKRRIPLNIGIAGLVVWYLASGAQGPRINTRLGQSS